MEMLAASAAFIAAWLACPLGDARLLGRLGGGDGPGGRDRGGRRTDTAEGAGGRSWATASLVEDTRRRTVVCAAALGAVLWPLAGPVPAAVGMVPLGVGLSWWLGTLESPSTARVREGIARDLPVAIDLLAACTLVGRPPDQALTVVARAVAGPLGARLDAVTARLALGADPALEWRRLLGDEQLAPLARTMLRSLESGAPLVAGLNRLAADRRRERRAFVQARARTVGVKAAGPLAACFLPAFMLIGVVPTIVGAFSRLVL